MKIVKSVTIKELQEMADKMDGHLVKADIDIKKEIVIVDMPMHFEGEQDLLSLGSKQDDMWGINLFPAKFNTDEFIVYESMINLKPRQNTSMTIQSDEIKSRIKAIVDGVVHE